MLKNSENKKHLQSDDERVASLFQPDVLLPEEFIETYRRKVYLEPEKRLMFAVLEDAISCYQKYIEPKRPREETLFQETEEWIFAKDGPWLFSFEGICEYLGIAPDYFRKGLLHWKQSRLRPKAKVYHLANNRRNNRKGALQESRPARAAPGVLKNGTD